MTTPNPKKPVQRPDAAGRASHRRTHAPHDSSAPPGAVTPSEHEGATDGEVGDLTGPGAGYDDEPVQEKDRGGVS